MKHLEKAFKKIPKYLFKPKELGYELPFERVPISPAFHYFMGGVETTLDAKIKGMKNLYAIGRRLL